ncbi:adenylosuccinate synthase [Halococcus agarilyticus]|uniref:adenylosuccinate synthase n=1 Tax=Halococcus agarilyticus TaxID=1232219 RepID=UPI0006781BF4|nr:adenylosuccinate synthase [Halococcus agarilyticus]
MTVTIVGAQLGDEGKGGMVDRWSETADVVCRYQGGDNAGHTVVYDDRATDGGATTADATDAGDENTEYKLSLVPSGAIRGKTGVLGNGCVINPATLFDEIEGLRERGLDPDVRVAERAHVIFPYHRALDGIEEDSKDDHIGTTGNGIGPTYEDKAARRGVRIGDLLDADVLRDRLEGLVPQKRAICESVYGVDPDAFDGAFDVDELFAEYRSYGERLATNDMPVNCGAFLDAHRERGDRLLFEGAQGTAIDLDHGNYPYVTSSNPTAGGAATGTGLGPTVVGSGEIVGIVKAYLSRVGAGPLPTEMGFVEGQTPAGGGNRDMTDLAAHIREAGGEYGTVTGRPRRIAWLDMPMLRHAARASGFTGLAINHVDTLAGIEEIRVGHAYDLAGETVTTMPATTERWSECEPQYRTFDGWSDADWDAVAREGYDALPANARTYVEYVGDELDVPIFAIGVGPDREQTIVLDDPF